MLVGQSRDEDSTRKKSHRAGSSSSVHLPINPVSHEREKRADNKTHAAVLFA